MKYVNVVYEIFLLKRSFWDTFKKFKAKLKYTEYLYLLSSSNHKLHHWP